MRIPVISMYGPWANWVGLGWKTIETRRHDRFRCLVGRRIGLHVALKWDEKALSLAAPYLTEDQVDQTLRMLKVGGAICWTASVANGRWLNSLDSREAMIDCGVPRFGLILRDVQVIEGVPCKGRQGIWYHDVPTVERAA